MARILVIDPESQLRRFLGISLSANGHAVVEAERAEQGLALFRSRRFDLVILELDLPDGQELASTIIGGGSGRAGDHPDRGGRGLPPQNVFGERAVTKPSPGTHGPEPRYSLMAMLGLLIILLAVVFGAYRVREQLPEIVARTPASAATQPEQDASAVRTPDWTGPRYFQGHPGARDETIQVLKPAEVATQVKRVAAARGVPVELVRELVAEQAQGHQSGNGAIDVHTLNLALDRRWPAK